MLAKQGLVEHDLASGREHVIVQGTEYINAMGESPDGKRIAFSTTTRKDGVLVSTLRVREEDGSIRDSRTATGEPWVGFKEWMPDGSGIIYALTGPARKVSFHVVPADGGPSSEMGILIPEASRVGPRASIRRDGRQFVFHDGMFRFECG